MRTIRIPIHHQDVLGRCELIRSHVLELLLTHFAVRSNLGANCKCCRRLLFHLARMHKTAHIRGMYFVGCILYQCTVTM